MHYAYIQGVSYIRIYSAGTQSISTPLMLGFIATMKPPATSMQLFVAFLVLCLHRTLCIPLEQFYPYGDNSGDLILAANDDQSSRPIKLTVPFPFFDEEKLTIFVSKACMSVVILSMSSTTLCNLRFPKHR